MSQQIQPEKNISPQSAHHKLSKYRPDIDGLRAIAVISVVVFHAFPKLLKGGFIGVDIFFVISGFLISTIIFSSLERGTFFFFDFYLRRIRRIFPALITVLITCYVVGWFVLLSGEYKQLGKHIAAGAGFMSNFVLWNESGYFDTATETKPLLHLWSLGIEEQFYIIWPLLLWSAWKTKFSFLIIIVVLATLSFSLNLTQYHVDPVADFYSPQTRFWELLIGACLAYTNLNDLLFLKEIQTKIDAILSKIIHKNLCGPNGTTLLNVKSISGALLIAFSFVVITKEKYFPGVWVLLPTIGAIFIISAGTQGWVNRTILSHRVLVWFGLISFPLYLWHWPLLSFARIMESERPNMWVRLAAIFLSIILAWLTNKLIEKPLRFGLNMKIKSAFLIFSMLIIGGVGYDTYKLNGLSFRYKTLEDNINRFNWPKSQLASADCVNKFGQQFNQYCSVSNINKTSEIVLLGDSNANHLYFGLNSAAKEKNVLMLGRGACLPFVNLTTRIAEGELNCQDWVEPALQYIESTKTVKTVILSMMGAAYINKKRSLTGGYIEMHPVDLVNDDDKTAAFSDGMRKTLSRLIKANKEIIFVISTPRLNFLPITCIKSRPLRLVKNKKVKFPCAINIKDYKQDTLEYRNAVNKVLKDFPQVKVFDTTAELCDKNLCWAMKNGKILYRDDVHLSLDGSKFISELLVKKLVKA